MSDSILNNLNESQQIAAREIKGAILVSAGAGTGKTRLLTHRVAYLINECGVCPENILAITFTNKATNEMRERIEKLAQNAQFVTVSTFHSLCVKILRANIHNFLENYNRFFTIYDESDKHRVIKKILNVENEKNSDFEKTVIYFISKAKNDGIAPIHFREAFPFVKRNFDIEDCYKKYEQELKNSNALDFDDLLIKTYNLFLEFPNVLEYYQEKFKFIHVDEFQDTNKVQYDILKMLAKKHGNIFIVGDEDQSIYAFRGANYKNLHSFKSDFEDVKVFKLERNYRSTKQILSRANLLINENKERSEQKNLYTENESGDEIVYKVLDSDYSEAEYISNQISRLNLLGQSFNGIGVLYRINALSRQIESALVANAIPYRIYGGLKFYARAEIKNLLAYLRLLVNDKDDEALMRIINFPKRSIGDVTIRKLVDASIIARKNLLEFILTEDFKHVGVSLFKNFFLKFKTESENQGIQQIAQNLVLMLDVNQIYNEKTEENENRIKNIQSFLTAINEFCEDNDEASLVSFLESVNLDAEITNNEDTNVVTLSTVHGVKGLEFDIVFIAGAEDGLFPYQKSISEGNLEEERRLAYVAVTRAKKKLYITRAKNRFSFGGSSYSSKSRFVEEMNLRSTEDKERKMLSNLDGFGYNYNKYQAMPKFFTQISRQNQINEAKEFLKGLSEISKAGEYFREKQISKDVKVKVGDYIMHARFGKGIVQNVNEQKPENAIIEFEDGKIKELNLNYAPVEILHDDISF